MPKFYLVINRDRVRVFRRRPNGFESEFFEGEPGLAYEVNRVPEAVNHLRDCLMDNNNLEDVSSLSFVVLSSGNELLDKAFEKALAGQICSLVKLEDVLKLAIARLKRDPQLLIGDFGINYDGQWYGTADQASGKFSLLAYTLTVDSLLEELPNDI